MPSSHSAVVITPDQLLLHWQEHRALTRRVIEAFPEKDLFAFSIGGMRPFSTLAVECIGMAASTLRGMITGEWEFSKTEAPTTKADLLAMWDKTTGEIEELWPQIPVERFQTDELAYGLWQAPLEAIALYVVDNEVHHRGQAYVYLRALGIEPPPFYARRMK